MNRLQLNFMEGSKLTQRTDLSEMSERAQYIKNWEIWEAVEPF